MPSSEHWLKTEFRTRLFAGIAVAVPLGATLLVFRMLFRIFDRLAAPLTARIFHFKFPGLGFLLTFLVIYLAGLFARNVVGKKIVGWFERTLVTKLPIVRPIYLTFKKIIESFSRPATETFKRVVLIEFPRPGVKSLGFVTGETSQAGSQGRLFHVFIPTVPNPTSGLLQLIPDDKVIPLEMPVEDAIRLIVSGGFLGGDRLAAA